MEHIGELRAATHASVRPFFLAYLDAGFLFLGLDAVELRVGSAKQVLPGIDAITNTCVADGHPQQIRNLGARELVVDCRAQMHDILLRRRLLKHHELIAAITCDKPLDAEQTSLSAAEMT